MTGLLTDRGADQREVCHSAARRQYGPTTTLDGFLPGLSFDRQEMILACFVEAGTPWGVWSPIDPMPIEFDDHPIIEGFSA